jgi:C4-dicarboxylate-specific signal transduction histidine kinase
VAVLAVAAAVAIGLADGARVLIVRTRPYQSDQVLVAVEDVGVGIAPENADRLFKQTPTSN